MFMKMEPCMEWSGLPRLRTPAGWPDSLLARTISRHERTERLVRSEIVEDREPTKGTDACISRQPYKSIRSLPAGTDFDHYQIQIAIDGNCTSNIPSIVHDNIVEGITNSQDNSAVLLGGTEYYWRVRVQYPIYYGPGDWSEVFTFTTA